MSKELTEIVRENTAWGVRLTVQPFSSGRQQHFSLCAEIDDWKPHRGCNVRFTFPGVPLQNNFRVLDADILNRALSALIVETRAVMEELKGKKR